MINRLNTETKDNTSKPQLHIIVGGKSYLSNYNIYNMVAGVKQLLKKFKTIIFEKNMPEITKKYCPVCNNVLKLDSVTNDRYKLYRCHGCSRYNELIPDYINYFKMQVV